MRSFIKSHRRNSSDRDPGQYSDGTSTTPTAPTFPSALASSPLLGQKPAFPDTVPQSPGKKSRNRLKKFLKQKVSTSNLAGLAAASSANSQHASPVSPTGQKHLINNQNYPKPGIPGSNRPSQEYIRKQQVAKPISSSNLPSSTVSSPTIFGTKTHEWGTTTSNNANTSPISDHDRISAFSPLPNPPPRKVLRFQNPSVISAHSNRSQSSLGKYQLINESVSSIISGNDVEPMRSHFHELDQIESGGSTDDFSIVVIKKNTAATDACASSALTSSSSTVMKKNSRYGKDQRNNRVNDPDEGQNSSLANDADGEIDSDEEEAGDDVDDMQSNSSSKSSKFSFVGRNTSMKYYKSDAQVQREEAVLKQKESEEHFNAFINDVESMQELQDDMNYIDFDEKDETDDLFNRKLFSISDEEEEDNNIDSGGNYMNFSDNDDATTPNDKDHLFSTENFNIDVGNRNGDNDDDLDDYLDEINEDDEEYEDDDPDNYDDYLYKVDEYSDDNNHEIEKDYPNEILRPGGEYQFSRSDQDITTDNISPGLLPVSTASTEVDQIDIKSDITKEQTPVASAPLKKEETSKSVSNDIHSLLARLANAHADSLTSRTSTFDSNITIKVDPREPSLESSSDATGLCGLGIQQRPPTTHSTNALQEKPSKRVPSISKSQKVILNGLQQAPQDGCSSVLGRFHRAGSIKYHQLDAKGEDDDLSFLNKRYSWLPNDDSETRLNTKSKTNNYDTLYEGEDEDEVNYNDSDSDNPSEGVNNNETGEYDYDIYGSYTEGENYFDDSMLEEVNRIPEDYDSDEWHKGQLPSSSVLQHSNLNPSATREKTKIKKTNMKSYTEHKNIGVAPVPSSNTNSNNTIKLDEKTITLFRPIRNESIKSQQPSNEDDLADSSSASIDSHNYGARPKSRKLYNNYNQLNLDIGGSEDLSTYEDEGEDDFQEGGLYYITPNNSRANAGGRKDSSPLTTISEVSFDSNISRSPYLS